LADKATAIFAQRLKEARALRGVSQRALGALIGMTKKNGSVRINRYEQLSSRADMDTAAALAKALEVPLAFLFAEHDEEAELLLAFSKLSSAERDVLLAEARKMAAPE